MKPRAFVVMPYKVKEAKPGTTSVPQRDVLHTLGSAVDDLVKGQPGVPPVNVNFDVVYEQLLKPALESAGLDPFRADEEISAGNILTDMFFELVTADVVVADVSILNANVYYELGVRHGITPNGTILVHGDWTKPFFDLAPERRFVYDGKLFATGLPQDTEWKAKVAAQVQNLARIFEQAVRSDRQTISSPVYAQLRGLKKVDWTGIETARAKYFGSVLEDLRARVRRAQLDALPGDILTLATEAPTLFHERKIKFQAAKALIGLRRYEAARPVLEELVKDPNDLDARVQLGLVYARTNQLHQAQVWVEDLAGQHPGNPDVQGILGRVFKDLWRTHWQDEAIPLGDRRQRAANYSELVVAAIRSYYKAHEVHPDSFYSAVNVVSLVTLLKHVFASVQEPMTDIGLSDEIVRSLEVFVRVLATASVDRFSNQPDAISQNEAVWATATLGELEMVAGDPITARRLYRTAATNASATYFQIDSMRMQLQLLADLGFKPRDVQPVIDMLTQFLETRHAPRPEYGKVVVGSGHMVDTVDRPQPRFPESKADAVAARIAEQLERWQVGMGDLAICGGACGADILFAEQCRARGMRVRLMVAMPDGDFRKASVCRGPSPESWEQRYFNLIDDKEHCEVFYQHDRLGPAPAGEDVFSRANRWMLNTARAEGPPEPMYAILVWEEQPVGDGPGGTAHFEKAFRDLGGRVYIVNPTQM